MKKNRFQKTILFHLALLFLNQPNCVCFAQTSAFAHNGGLKMLYDNRMYPQAVALDRQVFIVWRAVDGFPYINSYDLEQRRFSKPSMILSGMPEQVDAKKYKKDHHFAPVIWSDGKDYLHVLFGCHRTAGVHLVSQRPKDLTRWEYGAVVASSMSYPKVHQIYHDKILIYYRHQGHLGYWTYRISADDAVSWTGPSHPPVDLDAPPQDGLLAEHAGSYHTTCMSHDGKTLHVAFIWKVEEPVFNSRYQRVLDDHTQRYNLYYLKIDLPTGKAFNVEGQRLRTPVNKRTADQQCLVWDTQERVAAVGPAFYLDEQDRPYFLLPVSEETPHRCHFYFVRRKNDGWTKTAITGTSHPFNACHLHRSDDGSFRAYLVTGSGESISDDVMNSYGWGDRVEEWVSDDQGDNWKLHADLTPVMGHRYQNVKYVSQRTKDPAKDLLLFYGWQDQSETATGYLLDVRD